MNHMFLIVDRPSVQNQEQANQQLRQNVASHVTESIIYLKDPRTGCCFAYLPKSDIWKMGPALAYVPEEKIPRELLIVAEVPKEK